jgi:hypothetical protein
MESLDKQPKPRKMDMRFGTWDIERFGEVVWTGFSWLRIGTNGGIL